LFFEKGAAVKSKMVMGALILLLVGTAAVFTACDFLMAGDTLRTFDRAGLYQIIDGKRVLRETPGEAKLANILEIIRQDTVKSPVSYVIVLTKDELVKPLYLTPLGDRTRENARGEGKGRGKYNYALKDITVEGLNPVTLKLQPDEDRNIPLFVVGTYDEAKVWANGSTQGITLTLGKNIRVEGSENNPWPLIQVIAGGSVIIDGAVITGNQRIVSEGRSGGGIEIYNGGIVTMKAGEISNHSVALDPTVDASIWVGGGGISLDSEGTFIMEAGTVTGNTVTNEKGYATGGGILVLDHSSFTMNGGTISENKILASSAHGGGIFLAESSQYILNGGTVSGNEASGAEDSKGGGIYVATNTVYTPPQGITLTDNTPDETNSAVSEEENSEEEEDEEDAGEEEEDEEDAGEEEEGEEDAGEEESGDE
jgi:hypothetical protein